MNQTQAVRSAINVLIVVAVSVSLLQELINVNSKASVPPPTVTTPTGETVPLQPTGPILQGIRIQASDKFHQPMKQLLAKNQLNIEIASYNFQGNQYWVNMIMNWGHVILFYFLLTKYKSETDESMKKKILIGGAIAVFGWFYISANMKPQRLALQVHGAKVYDKDYLNDKEILDVLTEYEFDVEDAKEAGISGKTLQKEDAWAQSQQPPRAQQTAQTQTSQEQIPEQEIF